MPYIVEHADGGITQHFDEPGTAGVAVGVRQALTPRVGDLATECWDWEAGEWRSDLAALRARLIAGIDAERRRRGAQLLTPGQAVNLGYARKGAEAADYFRLSDSDRAALDEPARRLRWPWLFALVDAGAGDLAAVASEVRDSMAASEAHVRAIDAKAVVAKQAVRAADTEAAIRSAADINWEE